VIIPSSVTAIGDYAFADCSGLTWIESKAETPPTIYSDTFSNYDVPLLADSENYRTADYWKKFSNIITSSPYTPAGSTFEVNGLKYEVISVNDLTCGIYAIDEWLTGENVVIPETVVYKNRTFTPIEIKGVLIKGETTVKSVAISSCVTTIPLGVIWDSTLEKLTVNAPITSNFVIASNIGELVIPSTVDEFSADLTSNTIDKITIEDSETELTTSQFKCSGIKEVYLGRTVSASTFQGQTSLEAVTISDKVTSIGESVFSGCSGLTSVLIPNSVTSIGSYAFKGCSGLTSVSIPSSVTAIGSYAFSGCSGLTSVSIPNSVNWISKGAFYGCSGLTSVTIPNSVTLIGDDAFSGCSGLTSVTIPNSVTSIGWGAFASCSGLTSVSIPNSVSGIGGCAFENCSDCA
jgi:hypothetical protein